MRALKRHNPRIRAVVVEPGKSPVPSGGEAGPHKIEGVGIGYIPPLWDPSLVDEVIPLGNNPRRPRPQNL